MGDRWYLWWTWIRVHRRLKLKIDWQEVGILRRLHDQPSRFYHNWHHIAQTIRFIDANYHYSREADLARLALFFHDVIYNPSRKDNEEQSARRWEAYGQLAQLQNFLTWEECKAVGGAIRMTANHQVEASGDLQERVSQMVNDADMSIFLATGAEYSQYAQSIWREYQAVGKKAYLTGRLAFLTNLNTAAIFYTKKARDHFSKATLNVQWEIMTLEGHWEDFLSQEDWQL